MDRESSAHRLDAPRLLYDWGHRAQSVAVTMWKHEMVASLGVCKSCGRLPAQDLPMFGPRCEIAVQEWDVAQAAIKHLVTGTRNTEHGASDRPRGRTAVMRYAAVLTRIRPGSHRDELTRPESVICRCEFDDRQTATRTAAAWTDTRPVERGRERVKILPVAPGQAPVTGPGQPAATRADQPPATDGSTWTSPPSVRGAATPPT